MVMEADGVYVCVCVRTNSKTLILINAEKRNSKTHYSDIFNAFDRSGSPAINYCQAFYRREKERKRDIQIGYTIDAREVFTIVLLRWNFGNGSSTALCHATYCDVNLLRQKITTLH